MRTVNFDKLIKKYIPGASCYVDGYKIKYSNGVSPYIAIADPSGYVRLLDTRSKSYVDVYTGETLSPFAPSYNERSHYRILRRDEL